MGTIFVYGFQNVLKSSSIYFMQVYFSTQRGIVRIELLVNSKKTNVKEDKKARFDCIENHY